MDTSGPDLNSAAAVVNGKKTDSGAKRRFLLSIAAVCTVGLVVGLSVGLTGRGSKNDGKDDNENDNDPGASKGTPSSSSGMSGRLSAYSTSMMSGYSACDEFVSDLEEAARTSAYTHIDRTALRYYHDQYFWGVPRGGRFGGPMFVPMDAEGPPLAESAATSKADGGGGGETDFSTNNQVDGVDEADAVKSDGTHVYAAYGKNLVVWDARTGKEVSRTEIPTEDEDGADECDGDLLEGTTKPPPCYSGGWGRTRVVSLLLHQNRIAVVARTPEYSIVPFETSVASSALDGDGPTTRTLYGHKATRVFVYDTSDVGDGGAANAPLNLVKRKDLHGYYQSARSIKEHAHVVTTAGVNLWDTLYQNLDPIDFVEKRRRRLRSDIWVPHEPFDPKDLAEEDYRELAKTKVDYMVPDFAKRLAEETLGTSTPDKDTCQRMVRLALFTKPKDGTDVAESSVPFIESSVLSNFAKVTSFNLLDDDDFDEGSDSATSTATSRRLMKVESSGMFVPINSYSRAVYSSSTKLVIAGDAYEENEDGKWKEKTLLFSFGLDKATSVPESVGEVPGSLLNQFSMDHFYDEVDGSDYLRVATTNWAEWGTVDDEWVQTEESSSQVTVLKLPNDAQDEERTMPVVGKAEDLGKGERIYAVRFLGDRGFVVTFRQIDPFYTLDLKDPTNPVVVGELKIPGFSNYLHPVGGPDSDTILAVGQDADVNTGRTLGLQIALYDVSDMANPRQIKQYSEVNGENDYSHSDAQYDHRAFRYLEQTKVLILPVTKYGDNDFDGFHVYDVFPDDPEQKMDKRFEISHKRTSADADGDEVPDYYCWSFDRLEPRSLVFDGNVMTMKGHTVLSHDLDNEGSVTEDERLWMLNLDADRQGTTKECGGWW